MPDLPFILALNKTIPLVIGLLVLNIPFYYLLGKVFFRDFQDFLDCVKFWLTPDWLSAVRGEYWEDAMAQMKLWFFVMGCAILTIAEYFAAGKLLGWG